MACGLALKRPHGHEYESYLNDDSYGSEAKRARTATHCSPFRPQMGTIAANLPSTSSFAKIVKTEEATPFSSVAGQVQLSSSQLDAYLRSEIKNLRRRKLIPKSFEGVDGDASVSNENRKVYRAPKSPTQSGSDSEGEVASMSSRKAEIYTKPQFSLRQVQMICERLLKEQETRLRYEYETALTKKLEEQHEQYVQFAAEQLSHKRVESSGDDYSYSYLS
ncbi:unnamed protein product [Caenorhabditis bovis]|uniref:Akirin n=1 Tax=Caenorhabditis bovis TaxID=2654633 RepID=A0A8S1F666_9PELO|nr:unnamed protein product [Caenorhabditis bovis]